MSKSRPTRGAWIEMSPLTPVLTLAASRPTRGAWIEMLIRTPKPSTFSVAPHTGRVD